ncbi:site-specific integrase [Streptomyces sp. NPDC094034]|uniref:site-specific integrase n=1 Tax=Streptomyces sp. NPDC094034 TaxID=3155309 RepID=UPI003326C014
MRRRKAGLVDGNGNPTVTAHRFRHTVGTQLAEGGAQIQTIMAVLGHRNARMPATYSHISHPVLKERYENVIAADGRTDRGTCRRGAPEQKDRRRHPERAQDQLLQDRTRTRPLPAGTR